MLKTKQRRYAFVLYIGLVLATMGILIAYTGVDSPWPWMCVSLLVLVPVLYFKLVQLPYVVWKESYNVGVSEIDHDHKRLLELINRVVSASSYKLGNDYTREIFDKLIEYTKYHLEREEQLMDAYEYPDRENHKMQHVRFIGQVVDYYDRLDKKSNIAHHDIFDFLKNWLLSHIARSDKELGKFIQAKRRLESKQKPAVSLKLDVHSEVT